MHENRKFEVKIKLSNKSFGYFTSFIFLIIFLYPLIFYDESTHRIWAIIISLILFLLSLFHSKIFEPLKNLWLKIAKIISHILSISVMLFIFISTLVPIAIIMKILRYDGLKLKLKKNTNTYWIKIKNNNLVSFKDQF